MLFTITIISILSVAGAAWFVSRVLPFKVCPICAGVFLTWVGLVAAYFLGYEIDLTVPALLMGGTVVGLAYQLEKKLFTGRQGGAKWRVPFLWKTLFIPTGFVSAYGILAEQWTVFLLALVLLLVLSFLFAQKADTASADGGVLGPREETAGGLEKKMKDCC